MTFDEWWEANHMTPLMVGDLKEWARKVWAAGYQDGYEAGVVSARDDD